MKINVVYSTVTNGFVILITFYTLCRNFFTPMIYCITLVVWSGSHSQ